jgi:transposase-like protein
MVDEMVNLLQLYEWMDTIGCIPWLSFFFTRRHENWTWFMTHLQRAIGDLPLLAVSTDAYKGLENVVKDVFPHTEQRECFRHMM